MTTITIQITIDAGEDARVTVAPATVQQAPRAPQTAPEPQFEDELVPLPPEPDTTVTAFRGSAHGNTDQCPVHREPWKLVPAGVSKRTGKAYDAFKACPVQGCTQRPPERRVAS